MIHKYLINKYIDSKIIKVLGLIKSEKKPPEYFDDIDVIKELNKLKNFPWYLDEKINGITKAASGFVISKPFLVDYANKSWTKYLKHSTNKKEKVLILGGSSFPKEVELIDQFAEKNNKTVSSEILITDKNPIHDDHRSSWKNIKNITYKTLDITDTDLLYEFIKQEDPTIVTLVSVVSIFTTDVQEKILTTIYQSIKPGTKILYGVALPQTPVNFMGYNIFSKIKRIKNSIDDFVSATFLNETEQKDYAFLFNPQELKWSKKAYAQHQMNAESNLEWTLYITGQLDRFKRIGFIIEDICLNGVEGKFGSGRPLSFGPYMTAFLSKSNEIDLVLLNKAKKNIITVNQEIKLVPFDGSETEQYEVWFDRNSHKKEMQYEHKNTPYTSNTNKKESIEDFIKYVLRSPHNVFYRIEHLELGFVGHASINDINWADKTCRFSLHIGDKINFGKGIGSLVEESLLNYLKSIGFKKVYTSASKANVGSIKMIERRFKRINDNGGELINFEKDL